MNIYNIYIYICIYKIYIYIYNIYIYIIYIYIIYIYIFVHKVQQNIVDGWQHNLVLLRKSDFGHFLGMTLKACLHMHASRPTWMVRFP